MSTDTDKRRMEVLRYYHQQGRTLRELSDPRLLNRTPHELLNLARAAGLIFPDSTEISEDNLTIGRRRRK